MAAAKETPSMVAAKETPVDGGGEGNPDGGGAWYPGGYPPSWVLAIAASSSIECTAAALPHCGHTAPTWP